MKLSNLPRYLRERIVVEEERGCWLWIGPVHHDGRPIQTSWVKRPRGVRPIIVALDTCAPVPDGYVVTYTCDSSLCVAPHHLVAVKRGEHIAVAREQRGLVVHDATWRAKMVVSARKTHGVINMEIAREIRRRIAAGESQKAVALDLKMSKDWVSSIWLNKLWREPRSGLQLLAQQAGML